MKPISHLLFGAIGGIALFLGGAAVSARLGWIPMSTNAPLLPLEPTIARWAVHAHAAQGDRLAPPFNDEPQHLIAGARVYLNHCAGCHGLPDRPVTRFSKQMFPPIPQFFHHGVTDDPVGRTYHVTRNGIRLSGMLAFDQILDETQLWQVSWMLKRSDRLPAEALKILHP